jgi:putative copper export protein
MTQLFTFPWMHHIITLIHICAALFWMGWIVFIFLLLMPVVKRNIPAAVQELMPPLKQRVRTVVFWLILLIVATGLYNMYYRGLFDTQVLWNSAYGHRFLVKLGAALILFSVYFAAPYLTGGPSSGADEGCCDEEESSSMPVGLLLHVIAFTSGMVAALIGISLGG